MDALFDAPLNHAMPAGGREWRHLIAAAVDSDGPLVVETPAGAVEGYFGNSVSVRSAPSAE